MVIDTTRFGKIEIEQKQIIKFVHPIPGFTEKTYAIITLEKHHPFKWLQAVNQRELAFAIVDPSVFFPDYAPQLHKQDKYALSLKSEKEALFYVLTVIRGEGQVTVNLLAPIVINPRENIAKQVILQNPDYPVRQPLLSRKKNECIAS